MAGARERKRAERRKRKRRGDESAAPPGGNGASQPLDAQPRAEESFQERMSRRYEERNAEARAKLEPLEAGERPKAVTVGALVSALIAVIFTVSAVVAIFSSAEIDGKEPSPVPLAIFAVPLWMMAWGMWNVRYWAVLGFQMLLVLFMLSGAAALIGGETVLQMLGALTLLFASGALFYFMIRAMGRIQMPSRPGEP
jgi:hypothetical protein